MLPVFKEYRSMLYSFGLDLSEYDDDKLWIDRLIIRGFNFNGKLQKICRLSITEELKYEYKFYDNPPKNEELMNYEQTYLFFEESIISKEQESTSVMREKLVKYSNYQIILNTSTGKDSKLAQHVLDKVTTDYRTIFHNTTMDCADVYREVKEIPNAEIITPKTKDGNYMSFYNMVKTKGVPRQTYRWCCDYFKEGSSREYFDKTENLLFVMGMRNSESSTRKNYDWERSDSRENESWIHILPIRKWDELEVWLYTIHNNIPISQEYKKGYKRVGCSVVCPFQSKTSWILDKYWHKLAYDRWHTIIDNQFLNGEQWCINNCTRDEYQLNWNIGILRDNPTDEVIEEFMEYKGITDKTVALQYFNKTCSVCGKRVYNKNEVAMNLKYFGREISKFKCKKCLMKELGLTKDDWDLKVKDFKEQGCKLF